MGLVEPPFVPRIHPESLGNGVSDIPDFEMFWGSMPPDHPSLSSPLHKILDLPQ